MACASDKDGTGNGDIIRHDSHASFISHKTVREKVKGLEWRKWGHIAGGQGLDMTSPMHLSFGPHFNRITLDKELFA
jgi:hypothetical protein